MLESDSDIVKLKKERGKSQTEEWIESQKNVLLAVINEPNTKSKIVQAIPSQPLSSNDKVIIPLDDETYERDKYIEGTRS